MGEALNRLVRTMPQGSSAMVEFRLLGSVEANVDGEIIDVGPARQRCVLVALLAGANQVVSGDQLVDRVWGDRVPQRARGTLRTYLSRLRQALAITDDVEINRRSGGYVFAVHPSAVDLHRFRNLVAQARATTNDDHALALIEQALGLWRGEAFAGLDTPWINTLRDTLEAERLAVELDYTDLRLRRGQHGALLAELTNRASTTPLDERLAGQLMLALYRNGRQADALAHFELIRSRLAEELGADPSPRLQALHQQILTANPTLAAPALAARLPVPRQLPAAPGLFAGRRDELARLTTALDAADAGETVMISAITGAGGIGKTWLALQWAHQHLDRFSDGQLFVDLRGFAPTGEPMSPGTAIRGFLDALGVEPARIPVDLDAQVGLYRSLVAGKRMLIMLDNARNTQQVTSMLPGSSSCTVLVTSREQLTGLVTAHCAHPFALDMLNEHDARDLLARRLGQRRLDAETDAVTELLACCAGLPLALGIVAGRATAQPGSPLTMWVDHLRDAATRLGTLDQGDPAASLSAVLSWSYNSLTTEQAEVFELLGLAPGPDISLPAAANLVGLPAVHTDAVLRALEQLSLLQQHLPGRWRMHDLIRLYAASHSRNDQEHALRRLVDFYLHTAFAAERLLNPHKDPITIEAFVQGGYSYSLPDEPAAIEWCATEHPNLLAIHHLTVERGWHTLVWQLAWSMETFHYKRGHLDNNLAAWRAGLAASQQLGDRATQTMAHRRVGQACAQVGLHSEAIQHLQHTLTLAEHTGDLPNQAHTHKALAWAWAQQGEDRRALEHATRALRLFQTLDIVMWQAPALNAVGWYQARLGRYTQGRAHCKAALTLARRHHDRNGEASTLDSLGYIAHHTGQYTEAVGYYRQALTLCRDLGNANEEANTLDHLGHCQLALGEHDQAQDSWQQALELYQAQHRNADADRVQQQLAALGDPHDSFTSRTDDFPRLMP